jgi:phospholipid N-methyltransferase
MFLKNITKHVTGSLPQVIIEYNSDNGITTREILAKMHPESTLFAFEKDIEKCEKLNKIRDSRLRIRNLPAEEVNLIMYYEETIDCIISSVPFIDQSKNLIMKIIVDSYKLLKNNCFMIQVVDKKDYMYLYQKYFQVCIPKAYLNTHVRWVYECQKQ